MKRPDKISILLLILVSLSVRPELVEGRTTHSVQALRPPHSDSITVTSGLGERLRETADTGPATETPPQTGLEGWERKERPDGTGTLEPPEGSPLRGKVRIRLGPDGKPVGQEVLPMSAAGGSTSLTTGLEEPSLEMAEEAWEAAGVGLPNMERVKRHAFVVAEEAVTGGVSPYRPGLGFLLGKLFNERVPGLPVRIIAHDSQRAALLADTYRIPRDQVTWPREEETYEEALQRVGREFQEDRVFVHWIRTMPAGVAAWLEQVEGFFQLLGISIPSGSQWINLYTASDQATQFYADRMV